MAHSQQTQGDNAHIKAQALTGMRVFKRFSSFCELAFLLHTIVNLFRAGNCWQYHWDQSVAHWASTFRESTFDPFILILSSTLFLFPRKRMDPSILAIATSCFTRRRSTRISPTTSTSGLASRARRTSTAPQQSGCVQSTYWFFCFFLFVLFACLRVC
jgi:hypothetical protein